MIYSQFRSEQQSFQSSQGELKYIDKGEGEVIVLLHGIPTSSWLYRKMINGLAQTHRVIAPDMLGFGASASPRGYDIYEPSQHAKRLLELMNGLNVESWNHVFHDAGGLWTWELLKENAHRVKRLIILNTIIYNAGFNPPIRLEKGFITRFIMALYSNGISTNAMLKGLFNSGLLHNNLSKADLQGYRKPLLEGKTKAMYQFFSSTCFDLPNYESIIKGLKMPKLLIWGKHDSFLVLDKMKDSVVSDLNLQEEHIHLLEAKHFIQEEQPDKINTLILGFLTN